MDFKTVYLWVLNAIAVAKENVVPTLEMLEELIRTVESVAGRWGINLPAAAMEQLDEETLQLENQIIVGLEETNQAIDFERIKKILQRAKELGLLDVIMAALVSKVKIPGLPGSAVNV